MIILSIIDFSDAIDIGRQMVSGLEDHAYEVAQCGQSPEKTSSLRDNIQLIERYDEEKDHLKEQLRNKTKELDELVQVTEEQLTEVSELVENVCNKVSS